MRWSARLGTTLALLLLPGCGLILGAGDYQVGETSSTGTTGSETSSGSSMTSSSGTGGNVAGFVVSPGVSSVLGGASITFTAALDGAPATDAGWTVLEPNGGTISADGVYRAPLLDGVFHVRGADSSGGAFDDAEITVTTKAAPGLIASGDGLFAPTGFSSQSHLAYAEGSGEWWLFHDDASTSLRTMHSKDFSMWGAGQSLTLPQGTSGDGRDLSVASRGVGGVDVVHVTQGNSSFGRYHIRATLAEGSITFEPATTVNSGGDTAPDGCATAILDDGTVLDVSGWQATPQTPPLGPCGNGDVDVFIAEKKEDGSTFSGVTYDETVVWCVNNHVNAHQILGLGSTALILYEDGADDSSPVNVLMTIRNADGTWTPTQTSTKTTPPSVFGADQAQGLNDWAATVAGGKAHAVRQVNGAFEYRSFTLGGNWSDGFAIPAEPVKHNDGIFLAPYRDGLVLVAISESMGDPLVYTMYDGESWTAWTVLVPSAPVGSSRSFLSGFAPTTPGVRPAIIWTEDGQIRGALLP